MLSDEERDEFEKILRNLTTERISIGNGLVFCFDHADSSAELVVILGQALSLPETTINKKVIIF